MAVAQRNDGFLTLRKKKDFLRLWMAQLISMTIFNASNYALLILIENITHSTTMIGLAIICFSIPAIIFGAPAGVFVDHSDKRSVLWISNCLRAIATFIFILSLIINRNELWPAFLLTFVISAIAQFFAPAEQSSIPKLVSEQELMPALSLFNITFMLSQAVGYVLLAPIAISLLPTFHFGTLTIDSFIQLYAIIGILYLVCALLVLFIPAQKLARTQEEEEEKEQTETTDITAQIIGTLKNVWQEMVQGWKFVRHKKALFLAVIQLSFAGVLILVIGQLVTPIVTQLLFLPANMMAFIFAPAGIGLVLGSIAMPRISRHIEKSRAVFIGCIGLALATLLLPLLTLCARWLQPDGWNTNLLVLFGVALLMFVAGIALDFVNIPAQTALQELTPEWIKGRVLSLQLVLYNACSIPIILFIGAFSDIFGIAKVLYILFACNLAFGIWGVFYERTRINKMPPEDDEQILQSDEIFSSSALKSHD
ncbi:MAG TPA: MFS transporter [Dictyobacter sp.]|jgi:MFS family permease|nr:MFS transporter [Dictyobacter sp.]